MKYLKRFLKLFLVTILTVLLITLITTFLVLVSKYGPQYYDEYLLYPYIENATNLISTNEKALGTAFQVNTKNNKKYVVTNWHVCRDGNGSMNFLGKTIKILAIDVDNDLCLLEPNENSGSLNINNTTLYKHEKIISIGNPYSVKNSVQEGNIISEKFSEVSIFNVNDQLDFISCIIENGKVVRYPDKTYTCIKKFNVIDTTMQGGPGISGAPVVDKFGKVVGICNIYDQRSLRTSFIHVNHLVNLINKYENNLKESK